jgi:hypothetical protein
VGERAERSLAGRGVVVRRAETMSVVRGLTASIGRCGHQQRRGEDHDQEQTSHALDVEAGGRPILPPGEVI